MIRRIKEVSLDLHQMRRAIHVLLLRALPLHGISKQCTRVDGGYGGSGNNHDGGATEDLARVRRVTNAKKAPAEETRPGLALPKG